MFVIELIYKASLAEIDAHMAAHVMFLKKYYAAGNFLVSGRKIPRDGGIILAVGKSRRADRGPHQRRSVLRAGSCRISNHRVPSQPTCRRHSETDRAIIRPR